MSIGFNSIPGNIKAPIFAFEVNSGGQFEQDSRLLLVGHANSGSSLTPNVPIRCNNVEEAISLAGKGSMLAEMLIYARKNAPAQDIWLLPVTDTGTAEVRTITVGSVPAAGGYAVLLVGDEEVALSINAGDTANAVASAIASAINAYQNGLTKSGLPFTATVATNVVTLTARHKGIVSNTVDLSIPTVSGGKAPRIVRLLPSARRRRISPPKLLPPIVEVSYWPECRLKNIGRKASRWRRSRRAG